MTTLERVVLHPFKDDEASGECDACGLQPEDHPPAKPAVCHVDMWTSNLRTLIEVYCSQHGLLGQVPFSDAVTLRDEHMSTGGAPVETGPDASPDTNQQWRCETCRAFSPEAARHRRHAGHVRVYPYRVFGCCGQVFLAYGVGCGVDGCEWLSDDWATPGRAADDGRWHLRQVHT